MTEQNGNGKNKGVRCEAVQCAYHCANGGCNADIINVGPCDACSCSETVCATFQMKN